MYFKLVIIDIFWKCCLYHKPIVIHLREREWNLDTHTHNKHHHYVIYYSWPWHRYAATAITAIYGTDFNALLRVCQSISTNENNVFVGYVIHTFQKNAILCPNRSQNRCFGRTTILIWYTHIQRKIEIIYIQSFSRKTKSCYHIKIIYYCNCIDSK